MGVAPVFRTAVAPVFGVALAAVFGAAFGVSACADTEQAEKAKAKAMMKIDFITFAQISSSQAFTVPIIAGNDGRRQAQTELRRQGIFLAFLAATWLR